MLRQAIGRMTKEDLSRTAYIKARRTDNMAMMNRDLKKLFNAGFRYVFIDEVTLMEDFIDSAALFSDVFATMGMKIVLSGTDSLGFWLAMDEELYDRAKPIHTTFIPYREYTVVSKYCNLHYDVVSLTVKKHILFAKDVVLKIFALEEARSKNGTQDGQSSLIKRYSEETQFVMVDQWIQNGEINIDQLKDRQKEALLKWREKKNKAS